MSIRVEEIEKMDFSDVANLRAGRSAPIHPGEILLEDFLKPMGVTQYRLAKEIGVPQRRIGEIVMGKRAVTPDTGLRLSRFFGMSDGFWVGLQTDYDLAVTRYAMQAVLNKGYLQNKVGIISPYSTFSEMPLVGINISGCPCSAGQRLSLPSPDRHQVLPKAGHCAKPVPNRRHRRTTA